MKIIRFLKRAEKDLNTFFQIKMDPTLVILLNSRRDIDAVYGKMSSAHFLDRLSQWFPWVN